MTTGQLTDETAIRDLFDRSNQAWEAGDAHAYAAVFTADADYVTWFGQHVKGREAIEASHVPVFAKYLKELTSTVRSPGCVFSLPMWRWCTAAARW